jgi:hypothetical protein
VFVDGVLVISAFWRVELLERASEADSLTSLFVSSFQKAGKGGCIMVSRMLIDRRVYSATFLSV